MSTEKIVNVFPSDDSMQRLVVAIEQEGDAESRLVLRQESFSEDVGWFVQSRVAIEPEQVAGLKMCLTGQVMRQIPSSATAKTAQNRPRILRFDRASAVQVG